MLKIHKKIILLGLLAAILIIIPFNFSHGQSITDVVFNPFKSLIGGFAWVISTILYIVGFVFSKIVFFGGIFFNWTLDLNAGIIDSPIVSIGWALTRDIANLGFVLLIIMIAFSTILRVGSFQMKTALSKLIIAALLINFSLIGAAVFIDAAGIFTNFFINNAYESTSTQGGISQALATSLSLHQGLQAPPITGETDLSTFGAGIMSYIANIVFLDIMTIVGAITMFAIGAMFLLRYINLGILLILLPGAILGWTVGSGVWGDWFKKFLNYTFFGPIASFFIYLALKSTLIFQSKAGTYFTTAVAGDSVLENLAGNIASMIMIVSLLLLGLKSAEELAGALSVGGLKMANSAIKTFGSVSMGAIRGAGRATIGAGKATLGGTYAESLAKSGQKLIGSRFALVRGLGRRSLEQSKEMGVQYGKPWAAADIGRNLFEGAAGGLGLGATKIRTEQEKAEKKEDKEIERLAKKNIKYDIAKSGDAVYNKEYEEKIKNKQKEITNWLRTEGKGKIEDTTKKYETEAFVSNIKNNSEFSDLDPKEILVANNGDLEITKKFFEREGDIRRLAKITGFDKPEDRGRVEEALKNNFNNFKAAKDELLKKKKSK